MSVTAEAQAAAFYITQDELLRRPQEHGYAIDPKNPAEIDDAIWVENHGDGDYTIKVHVADAGLLLGKVSLLEEAGAMGWSRYAEPGSGGSHDLMLPDEICLNALGLDTDHFGLGAPAITIAVGFDASTRRATWFDAYKSRLRAMQ